MIPVELRRCEFSRTRIRTQSGIASDNNGHLLYQKRATLITAAKGLSTYSRYEVLALLTWSLGRWGSEPRKRGFPLGAPATPHSAGRRGHAANRIIAGDPFPQPIFGFIPSYSCTRLCPAFCNDNESAVCMCVQHTYPEARECAVTRQGLPRSRPDFAEIKACEA